MGSIGEALGLSVITAMCYSGLEILWEKAQKESKVTDFSGWL